MQKNNLTLHNAANPEWKLISLLTLATLTQWLKRTSAIQTLKKCYADIMGIKLTSEQTVYVSYAQIASVLTLMPFNINQGWRALFFMGFCIMVKQSGITQAIHDDGA
ncbi:hypothetical protein [Prevotellamassilia timonensis]|uniref:hypothetical protein n=1 Tax=Prevotellamassilia timonensis TaxID=1852370 RepID=UPI003078D1A9